MYEILYANSQVEAVKEAFETVEMVNVATLSVVIEVLAKVRKQLIKISMHRSTRKVTAHFQ